MSEDVRPEGPRTHPRQSSLVSLLSGWAQQGVQSYFATQRVLLDLAMQQNASVMHILQDRLSNPRHSPTTLLTDLASGGISNFIEAQQVLLDLTRKQNEITSSGVEGWIGGSSAALAMTELLRRSVDTMVEMHQKFLKIADKQTHVWMEAANSGKLFKNDALVDLAREAMENFIHAEKQFLDGVAEEAVKATSGKHLGGSPKKISKIKLTELAQHATEAFIDAQKKLFDVAGQQLNLNLKTASKTMEVVGPLPIIPFSELTREGVKSFVDAQKALMKVITKPDNGKVGKPDRRRKPIHAARRKAGHAVA